MLRLRKLEITVYFSVYIAYLIYGLWKLYQVRNDIIRTAIFQFAEGWKLLERPRDDSNDELENFTAYIIGNWHWYVLHIFVSIFACNRWPQYGSIFHALVSIVALVVKMQLLSLCIITLLLISYYTMATYNSKLLTWFLSILWMVSINLIKNSTYIYAELGYNEYFTLIVMLSWCLLRCCSFTLSCSIDRKTGSLEKHNNTYTLVNFLGYVLYYPTLVYGPFLEFHRYMTPIQTRRSIEVQFVKIMQLLWELVRVLFWWLVLQLSLHFFYVHYMARDVTAVKLVHPVFGQHAVGYYMGQFFFLYYIITYGLGIAFAHFDELNPPSRPRCIGRIHFYSDMWKYFDEGLYEFLFKHIYCQLCAKNSSLGRKLFATAATFAFVYAWHGCYTYVLIWSVMNFCCLVAEKFFKALVASPAYISRVHSVFGIKGTQYLNAFLATQLFIPAAFSNVYFISGKEVGDFLMRGAYMSGWGNYIALSVCSFCFFQCSELILNVRKQM
ncbi:protein-cysteine N-palmitoyltransferase Rasp [Teleopsis dalmanni]|uniref:protein-cysteine N-palmitoyltransferase Rasp n=1 Tax=Teleopsis dalmanni TaxID=139649 RepID=UPI0018CF40D5|nr:protein-cysteine N-palmitoyltransferase Rasp [Teleopsis dalmanni]